MRVQCARIGLKINAKKTKSLWLEKSQNKKVMLGNEKIYQVGSFTYLSSIVSKDDGSSEDVKSRITKAYAMFFTVKKKFGRIERYVCKTSLEFWKLQR